MKHRKKILRENRACCTQSASSGKVTDKSLRQPCGQDFTLAQLKFVIIQLPLIKLNLYKINDQIVSVLNVSFIAVIL